MPIARSHRLTVTLAAVLFAVVFCGVVAAAASDDTAAPRELSAQGPFMLLIGFNAIAFGWLEWVKRRSRARTFIAPPVSSDAKRV